MRNPTKLLQPKNRRRADRVQINLPMRSQGTRGRTLNISKSGLRYLVPRTISPGTRLKLSVEFQGGTVDCVADSVWVHPLGVSSVVGVRFVDRESSEKIGQHLDQLVKI